MSVLAERKSMHRRRTCGAVRPPQRVLLAAVVGQAGVGQAGVGQAGVSLAPRPAMQGAPQRESGTVGLCCGLVCRCRTGRNVA